MAIELRKPKGRGGIGGPRNLDYPRKGLKAGGKLRAVGKTKRGQEIKLFRLMRRLVIQEVHEVTDIPVTELEVLELDHIWGRNDPKFGLLGAILSPLNLQLITREQHKQKTNSEEPDGQRFDYRDTKVQERMVALSARILNRTSQVFNLQDLRVAIEAELEDGK